MNEASITDYIIDTFEGVKPAETWGDIFYFYNPDLEQTDEIYFATLKRNDDDYDRMSKLERPSIFRLNIGVSKATYQALFGAPLPRPDASGRVESEYDFSVLDQLLPHPVYGRQYWVCILNPSDATFETVKPLLAEAYALAVDKYHKRASRG